MKPRILLDVDGVLADFVTPALEVMKNITGIPAPDSVLEDWDLFRSCNKEDQSKIYSEFKKEGWCYAIKPYEGALEGVTNLREIADVYFVTSPMHGPHWAYERTKWLIDYFNARTDHVIHTNAKYVCRGRVLVDDKPSHVMTWLGHHLDGFGVLWEQPYNRNADLPGNAIRTRSWTKVCEAVRVLTCTDPGYAE